MKMIVTLRRAAVCREKTIQSSSDKYSYTYETAVALGLMAHLWRIGTQVRPCIRVPVARIAAVHVVVYVLN